MVSEVEEARRREAKYREDVKKKAAASQGDLWKRLTRIEKKLDRVIRLLERQSSSDTSQE